MHWDLAQSYIQVGGQNSFETLQELFSSFPACQTNLDPECIL